MFKNNNNNHNNKRHADEPGALPRCHDVVLPSALAANSRSLVLKITSAAAVPTSVGDLLEFGGYIFLCSYFFFPKIFYRFTIVKQDTFKIHCLGPSPTSTSRSWRARSLVTPPPSTTCFVTSPRVLPYVPRVSPCCSPTPSLQLCDTDFKKTHFLFGVT